MRLGYADMEPKIFVCLKPRPPQLPTPAQTGNYPNCLSQSL
jgi:hypothetical protein